MKKFDDTRIARNTKITIIVGSLATMLLLGMEAWREHFAGEWREHQVNYAALLPAEFRAEFEPGLKQAFLPELGRVDRCQTCHVGIDNPSMAGQAQPLGAHPGEILRQHPAEDFGCTICHQGQGRATWLPDAHGEDPHWEAKMLRGAFVYTTCGQCHPENSPYGEFTEQFGGRVADPEIYQGDLTRNIPGAALLEQGKALFVELGCLGCHSYRGKGALLGRELTHIGDKGVHGYDFTHLPPGVERTPLAWLTEHFLDPGAISPGTVMPDMGVDTEQATALAAYMLSFRSQDVPARFRAPSSAARGEPATGKQLYELFCIACHGRDLVESDVPDIRTPALGNPDLLSVATDQYLKAITTHGRSNTEMPAWGTEGGLTESQIDRIVAYIRSFELTRSTLESVSAAQGDPEMGRAIYRGNCANCHGKNGEGGLGTALSAKDSLMMVSDELVARTVIEGRPNAGMPSWKTLTPQQASDVLAYLKSWRGSGVDPAEVSAHLASGNADVAFGAKLFGSHCAICHGADGEGMIGPSLGSPGFLSIASDEFLIHTIAEGRPSTAMPAWAFLSAADVGDLVAFIRGLTDAPYTEPVAAVTQGDADNGGLLYRMACASCHGPEGAGGVGPQLRNPVLLANASDGFLYQTIAHGRLGSAMRAFLRPGPRSNGGGAGIVELSHTQIADLVAYLKSLRFRTPDPNSFPPVLGNVVRGRQIYSTTAACVRCHGEYGEGAVGPAIGNSRFLDQTTEGFLLGTMVLGREGTEMRKFSSGGITDLPPEDLIDVAAYVRTLPPRSPDGPASWRSFLATGPLREGAMLFEHFCASCHGTDGRGGYAPELNNREFLSAASDGFLVATIARGRRNTPMRAFGPATAGLATLTADEIRTIVGYIRSWQTADTRVSQK